MQLVGDDLAHVHHLRPTGTGSPRLAAAGRGGRSRLCYSAAKYRTTGKALKEVFS